MDSLEERALLSGGLPYHVHEARYSADFIGAKHDGNQRRISTPSITILNSVSSHGYQFTNFDGPNAGSAAGTGTMMNGIANSTTVVGFTSCQRWEDHDELHRQSHGDHKCQAREH